jgi:hypothetical protein
LLFHERNILNHFAKKKYKCVNKPFLKERWLLNLRQQKENRVAFDACVNKTRRQLLLGLA